MAMVYCRLADLLQEQRWLQLARRSMVSLYALNADTTGLLRTRSHSPYWDHAPLPNPRHEAYYQADSSRKFRSQAIAVIACSLLLGRRAFERRSCGCVHMMAGEPRIDHIYEQLSRPVLPTFWDGQERLWKTEEGAATYYRYAGSVASCLRCFLRAVDAALGAICCARMLLVHRDGPALSKADVHTTLLVNLPSSKTN